MSAPLMTFDLGWGLLCGMAIGKLIGPAGLEAFTLCAAAWLAGVIICVVWQRMAGVQQ